MTPDELREQCRRFADDNFTAYFYDMAMVEAIESLCREMIAVGLERAELEYHRYKAGRPSTSNTTYAQWLAAEAQQMKEVKS